MVLIMYNLFYLHEREFLNKELHITEKWGNGLYQQTLEDSKETIMDNKLFSRMQYEPCVLIIGKEYKKVKREIFDYGWNMVVTTSCDMGLSARLKNDKRLVQDIFRKQEMQANLLDKRNLHVVRLLGQEEPNAGLDELELEDAIENAAALLERVAEIINRNGIILIENFNEPIVSYRIMRNAFKGLCANQQQIYIFNYSGDNNYITDLVRRGIVTTFSESINYFFEENFYQYEESFKDNEESMLHIYIDDKKETAVSVDKNITLETDSFAELLNVSLMNEIRIPQGMFKDYFYLFLKNSVREPQWYGYEYGFNIQRSYEESLYKKVKKGLENVGRTNNKPLLLVGQTGTGKSIALAALAHKIFYEKKYPVIFINNPDVNFYYNNEYKQKEVSRKKSPAFMALDKLLENLENKGAKAILLIWDTSSYDAGREKCYRLYQALLSRGRKVYLVSTAYENKNEAILNEQDIDNVSAVEESVLNKKFVECYANVTMSDEVGQLTKILLDKCSMAREYVDEIIDIYARQSSNFLSLFYQVFDMLRGDLSKGVYREASLKLQELEKFLATDFKIDNGYNLFAISLKNIENELKKAGIVDSIKGEVEIEQEKVDLAKEEFIKCIALCSQFKLKMPYDFALRILGTYNPQIIRTLSSSTFFQITKDYYGNYEIAIRTPLEAAMYLRAKDVSAIEQIDSIKVMLKNMKTGGGYGQQEEVRLCEKLIRIIGPNNPNSEYGKKYRGGYEEIIDELKKLREERDIWEPILVSQEITFIREYYGNDNERNIEERISWLKRAVDIADKILSRAEYFGLSVGIRNTIIVESANSKLLLCQLNGVNDARLYKQLRRDLREVIRYDSLNYYAYVTLLKGSIAEYDNEQNKTRQVELLEAMCSVADEITLENAEIAESGYVQRQVTLIYSRLKDVNIVQNYVDELAANGSAAGVYAMARKRLYDCEVNFKKGIIKDEDRQIAACKYVYNLFRNDKYASIVLESESCQYMFLNVLWILNNKGMPIYKGGECWCTFMDEKVWGEILALCNNYIEKFCSESINAYKMDKNIKYIQALCLAQLGRYLDCVATLKSIEEDSTVGIQRILTKHMICDEYGVPRKFTGRLGKYDEIERRGMVYIEEFGRKPLYYYGPNLKMTNHVEGAIFTDLEVGLCSIAPKVYRNTETQGG